MMRSDDNGDGDGGDESCSHLELPEDGAERSVVSLGLEAAKTSISGRCVYHIVIHR